MIGGRDSRRETGQLSGYDDEQDNLRANQQAAIAERAGRYKKRASLLGRLIDKLRRR